MLKVATNEDGVLIPLSTHKVDDNRLYKETIYGQIVGEKLNGIGRRIEINTSGSVG